MTDDLNPAIIKRTQDTLGKYVKKPSLTEKLLKKPPFRFLHDVLSVVIKDTGYFVGLYTPEELTYENIKDRDDKMKFLQKMIDVVKLTTNSSLAIRTSKIVAGQEAEKTNELLQLIGEIIDKKLDWQTSVEQVLSGKTPRKESPRKTKESSNKVSKDPKSKDKPNEKSKDKESKSKDLKTQKSLNSKIINKDDKTKIKTKDKTVVKASTKEKTSRVAKGSEKTVKKSLKDSSNTKTNTSNKSSPSPITQDSKKDPDSIQIEVECKHEEEKLQQQVGKTKTPTPPRKLSNSSITNEILKDIETIKKENSLHSNLDEKERLSSGKVKKSSAKSRKSSEPKLSNSSINNENINDDVSAHIQLDSLRSGLEDKERLPSGKVEKSSAKIHKSKEPKINENFGEQIVEKESSKHLNSPKLETLATSLQQEFSPSIENQELQELSQNDIPKNSPPPRTQTQKQIQATSPPANLTNEIKRETTFTRENSKESSSNQSSLVNRPRTSLRPPSARPPSARPGAPRRRDKNIEIILQPNDQIKMSGIQVKLETFGDLDDDGENLVIIENPNANDALNDQQTNLTESEKMMQDETLEQGHLVQQILETQKELVQQQNDANNKQKGDKDSANGLVMRQTSARHMNNLRDVIQNLTKSVNPLGKLMDFIPEDIDAMQLELTMWRDAYTQAANELKREKSLTESSTEPMKTQLTQIEANIAEYMEMIDASRVKNLQNSEKIFKMLTTN